MGSEMCIRDRAGCLRPLTGWLIYIVILTFSHTAFLVWLWLSQMLRPDFDELANSFIDEATFAAIDCKKLPETAKDAGVTQYPTFSVLHEVRACSYANSCVELILTQYMYVFLVCVSYFA